MTPLIQTNPFLRDPEKRRRMLEENVFASSVFEGARGLPPPKPASPARTRRSKASTKKSVKAS